MFVWRGVPLNLTNLAAIIVVLLSSAPSSVSHHVVLEGSSLLTEERERYTLYQVHLAHIPIDVCSDDFHVDLLGTQFVNISVQNTNITWRIRLNKGLPSDVIFYPEYSTTMEGTDGDSATWTIKVRIPKYYELSPIKYKRDEL